MSSMDQAVLAFAAEARELLVEMEDGLLRLESEPNDEEAINSIFRAAHTIKGTAGIFSFDAVEKFTHVVENVLEKIRSGKLGVDGELIALLLSSRDHIGKLVEEAVDEVEIDANERATGEKLCAQLKAYLGETVPEKRSAPQTGKTVQTAPRNGSGTWQIDLRFGESVLRDGMDPLSFMRYLTKMGEIKNIEVDDSAMPKAADMNPESCYLRVIISFESASASKADIEKVFEFVKEECEISILPPVEQVWEFISAIEGLPDEVQSLGELLQESGVLSQEELLSALEKQGAMRLAGASSDDTLLGDILVSQGRVREEVVKAALDKQDKAKKATGPRQLRVDADKLDILINLVGELVIAGATTNLLAQNTQDNNLLESISSMSRLVEEIRDSALRLRMVQIGETFNRFQRVVRDVSRELGKNINLVVNGGETELDKTMVEKISDPLMHLVRNAMDHGIEASAERAAAGKYPEGTLQLNAYHDSGSIVIQVSDDGRGLNKEKLLNKAIAKGIVDPGKQLSDQEIYRLIFEPGLSTADQVTNLSGRGVGMDVVKKNIESLRGSVDVESEPGQGTTINIRLPLTLAIIDGFLVEVNKSTYVIPLDMVVECIELSEDDENLSVHNNYINLRGRVLPFLRLRDMFHERGSKPVRENIVVVQNGDDTAGLVVDELLGEFQTVIKPLGKLFENLQGAAGSTILGTGEVAIILDVPGLIHRAVNRAEGVTMPTREQGGTYRQMTLH